MSSIRVSVEGEFGELQKELRRLGSLDRAELNRAIAEALRTSTDERFDAEAGPDGAAWRPSIRASAGGRTLTDTAALRNSIHSRSSAAGAEIGTNLIYAATHQFGDGGRTIRAKNQPYLKFQVNGRWYRKRQVTVKIPARPYLGLSDDDRDEIREIIEEAVGRKG